MYSKIPFIVGKSYICQRDDIRSADSFFELGKVYRCVKIKYGDEYSKTFILDKSVVTFLTDNGKEISYFGSTADSYFSSNPEQCAEKIDNEITSIQNRIDNDIIEIQDLEDQILALKRANDNRCEIQNVLNTRKSEILNINFINLKK